MKKNKYKQGIFFCASLFVFIAGISFFYIKGTALPPQEHLVEVTRITAIGADTWLLPKRVLVKNTSDLKDFVYQVVNLRARKIPVELLNHSETGVKIKKGSMPSGALVIVNPQGLKENDPVIPAAGLEDRELLRLLLEAGISAVEKEDVRECLRFLSPRYQDPWGYNSKLIEVFLRRAFKEFSRPRLELLEDPGIQIEGNRAIIQTALRLRAIYQGHSNYLLGDSTEYNPFVLYLEKDLPGWKVVQVRGLKPLGFGERFLKLIGSEIGLPLDGQEEQERRQACMPCRERMAERFGKKD